MARYFFHVIDGMFQVDSVGEEFATLSEAHGSAAKRAVAAIVHRDATFWKNGSFKIIVTDAAGETLFEITTGARTYN